jgi:hypothetical protein
MKPVQHKTSNAIAGRPPDGVEVDQTKVWLGEMPITVAEHDGIPVVYSFWRLTPEERQAVAAGKNIVLRAPFQHPMVQLGVEDVPFEQLAPNHNPR